MKIAIFSILAIIGIFFIITLFNALTVHSKQPTPVETTVFLDEDAAISHLSEGITYKTISYEDQTLFEPKPFKQFLDFLKKTYPLVFERLEVETINQYALLLKWKGEDSEKKPVGLTAHYDVIPVLKGTEAD